ncbi:MAG: alcohol dehydrogenase catalytic domain-containing protein, partial [Chloroflexota bacterium]
MKNDRLNQYKRAQIIHKNNQLWPLYGAGFENLGQAEQPIEADLPSYGPDELLVRHDACGLCFSDIKVINSGEAHPRIYHEDWKTNPVILGHEVALTIVGVGKNLSERYQVGERFIVQPDIYFKGIGYAYGYMIQGGLSQYNVIDHQILEGDEGSYLLKINNPALGYAEGALTEPWACVMAAYQLNYRTALKAGGVTWVIGTPQAKDNYYFSTGFDETNHPNTLILTNVPAPFFAWLKEKATQLNINIIDRPSLNDNDIPPCDDIIVLGSESDVIEAASPHLADHGILALIAQEPLNRPVNVDIGGIHYNRWTYVGSMTQDISRAYQDHPIEAELKASGRTWIAGADGPMGQMHTQRAVQLEQPPATILCTARRKERLPAIQDSLGDEAEAKGITLVCTTLKDDDYADTIKLSAGTGFDDVM